MSRKELKQYILAFIEDALDPETETTAENATEAIMEKIEKFG